MKNPLANLAPRERMMVYTGAACLLVFIIGLMWISFIRDVNRLQSVIIEQRELDQWMTASAKEAKRLQGKRPSTGLSADGQSLLALVDKTAKQNRLGSAMKRVEPEGQDKVRISMDDAFFDDLSQWLETLELNHGVLIERITIDRQDKSGYVNARLTLLGTT